jgi:hypothetical protein
VRRLTLDDLPSPEEFLKDRDAMRRRVIALKALRRVAVGPLVSLTFENHATVLWQVLEMCRVEGHTTPQKRREELETDNEMLPDDGGLAATMFLELEGEAQLRRWLPRLSGVEGTVSLRFGGREVKADYERGRSREDTTSCVHYVKFPLTLEHRRLFPTSEVTLAIDHPEYRHAAVLSPATRDELAKDLDGAAQVRHAGS